MRIPNTYHACNLRCWLALLLVAASFACADDATPDPGFADSGFAIHQWPADTIQAETITGAVAADGSVIAAGWISYPSPQQHYATTLLRYRNDGTPDPGFGNAGLAQLDLDPAPRIGETIYAVFPRADGSLLMLAGVQFPNQSTFRPVLVSVRADGTLDTTFGQAGIRSIDLSVWTDSTVKIRTAVMQPDGKIVMVGSNVYTDRYNIAVGRVLADGSPDTSFSRDGWMEIGSSGTYDWFPETIALDNLGSILIAGRADEGPVDRPVVFRMSSAGVPDTDFGTLGDGTLIVGDLQGSWTARAIVPLKRAAFGSFGLRSLFLAITAHSPERTGIVAINDNGSLTTTFGDNGFVDLTREQGSNITTLAMRGDQRLVAAGFIDPNGSGTGTDLFVARMDIDGHLDTSFDHDGVARYTIDPVGTSYDQVATMLLSAQRPVIIGAAYDNLTPGWYSAVLRLQSDRIFANGFDM